MTQNRSRAVTVAQAGDVEPDANALREAEAFTKVQRALEGRRDQLATMLGETVDVDRYLTVVLQAIQKTPALLTCSLLSILSGVRTAAQYGLEVGGPLSDASLIPEKGEARLQIEYRGLRKLALRDPDVLKVDAELVYERDVFELQLGDEPRIHHLPYLDGDRGSYRGAYAFAKLRSGEIIPLWLSIAELNKRRDVSRSFRAGSGPWIEWAAEMYRKTALSALVRSKLRLDPIAREAVMLADDGDPRLAGVPVPVAGRQLPAGGDAAARARRMLGVGTDPEPTDEKAPESAQDDPGGQEPAQAVTSGAEPEPEAQQSTGESCAALSIYGDGSMCGKAAGHVERQQGRGANIHRSAFATWEDGQQA